ncbi:hypothetical protein HDV05_003045, partial [Chytridiales sp. JEL 0842]
VPLPPSNKRKLPDEPSDAMLKKIRGDQDDDDVHASKLHWGVGTASSSERTKKFEDEDDERFNGDGLTDKHRHILDIVNSGEE